MSEILFRGKRKDNGEWAEGYFGVFKDSPQIFVPLTAEQEKRLGGHIFSAIGGLWHLVILKTVGQYTGLTDKNGKKIFEGDIVLLTDVRYDNEWKAVVVFGNPYCQYSWGWNLQYIGKKPKINPDILLWVEMEDVQVYCEVIGNVHDNPELMEGAGK